MAIRFLKSFEKEYKLMYGNKAEYCFNNLEQAKEHIDKFLFKLNNLKSFL